MWSMACSQIGRCYCFLCDMWIMAQLELAAGNKSCRAYTRTSTNNKIIDLLCQNAVWWSVYTLLTCPVQRQIAGTKGDDLTGYKSCSMVMGMKLAKCTCCHMYRVPGLSMSQDETTRDTLRQLRAAYVFLFFFCLLHASMKTEKPTLP